MRHPQYLGWEQYCGLLARERILIRRGLGNSKPAARLRCRIDAHRRTLRRAEWLLQMLEQFSGATLTMRQDNYVLEFEHLVTLKPTVMVALTIREHHDDPIVAMFYRDGNIPPAFYRIARWMNHLNITIDV